MSECFNVLMLNSTLKPKAKLETPLVCADMVFAATQLPPEPRVTWKSSLLYAWKKATSCMPWDKIPIVICIWCYLLAQCVLLLYWPLHPYALVIELQNWPQDKKWIKYTIQYDFNIKGISPALSVTAFQQFIKIAYIFWPTTFRKG